MPKKTLLSHALLIALGVMIAAPAQADLLIDAEPKAWTAPQPVAEEPLPEIKVPEIKPTTLPDITFEMPEMKVEMPPLAVKPVHLPAVDVAEIKAETHVQHAELASIQPQEKATPEIVKSSAESVKETVEQQPVKQTAVVAAEPAPVVTPTAPANPAVEQGGAVAVPADQDKNVDTLAGTPKGEEPQLRYLPVTGWGKDVPLDIAVQQIVPSNWKVEKLGLSGKENISWESQDQAWNLALQDIAQKNGWSLTLHNDEQRVVLAKAAVVDIRIKEEEPKHEADFVEAKTAPLQNAEPAVDEWVLDPAFSLKENVRRWAEKAGWNTPEPYWWSAADYPIYGRYVFQGDFESEDGPLAQLISAYQNSEQPLRVSLSRGDRVIMVQNKNFRLKEAKPGPGVSSIVSPPEAQ